MGPSSTPCSPLAPSAPAGPCSARTCIGLQLLLGGLDELGDSHVDQNCTVPPSAPCPSAGPAPSGWSSGCRCHSPGLAEGQPRMSGPEQAGRGPLAHQTQRPPPVTLTLGGDALHEHVDDNDGARAAMRRWGEKGRVRGPAHGVGNQWLKQGRQGGRSRSRQKAGAGAEAVIQAAGTWLGQCGGVGQAGQGVCPLCTPYSSLQPRDLGREPCTLVLRRCSQCPSQCQPCLLHFSLFPHYPRRSGTPSHLSCLLPWHPGLWALSHSFGLEPGCPPCLEDHLSIGCISLFLQILTIG